MHLYPLAHEYFHLYHLVVEQKLNGILIQIHEFIPIFIVLFVVLFPTHLQLNMISLRRPNSHTSHSVASTMHDFSLYMIRSHVHMLVEVWYFKDLNFYKFVDTVTRIVLRCFIHWILNSGCIWKQIDAISLFDSPKSHRKDIYKCNGHYLSRPGDWVKSSQHLCQ